MKKNLSYIDSVHRDGCIWNLSCMVLMLLFPAAVCLIFGVSLDWHGFWMGLLATAPMFWAVKLDIPLPRVVSEDITMLFSFIEAEYPAIAAGPKPFIKP